MHDGNLSAASHMDHNHTEMNADTDISLNTNRNMWEDNNKILC